MRILIVILFHIAVCQAFPRSGARRLISPPPSSPPAPPAPPAPATAKPKTVEEIRMEREMAEAKEREEIERRDMFDDEDLADGFANHNRYEHIDQGVQWQPVYVKRRSKFHTNENRRFDEDDVEKYETDDQASDDNRHTRTDRYRDSEEASSVEDHRRSRPFEEASSVENHRRSRPWRTKYETRPRRIDHDDDEDGEVEDRKDEYEH